MQIRVILEENDEIMTEVIKHKKPRLYMIGWSFKRMMKYLKEELYWQGIKEDCVKGIIIETEYEYPIMKGE